MVFTALKVIAKIVVKSRKNYMYKKRREIAEDSLLMMTIN